MSNKVFYSLNPSTGSLNEVLTSSALPVMTAQHLDLDCGFVPEKEVITKFLHCLDFNQVQKNFVLSVVCVTTGP
jgi:hypothetical protein